MSLAIQAAGPSEPALSTVAGPAAAPQSEHAILQSVVRAATDFLHSTELKDSLHTLLARPRSTARAPKD
ncbi:MAG TPA: hypothetical protein VHG09_03820, partial [Longimicrobiales bacterium]|nr:hypothetical protein [Longimicrobiales bacterium]